MSGVCRVRVFILAAALALAAGPAGAASTVRDAVKRAGEGQIRVAPEGPRPYIEYRGPNERTPVETLIDKGPIIEMIVNCHPQSGIITYSKIERLYCSPKRGCSPAFETAYARTCGPR
jgi:hypothetical protein